MRRPGTCANDLLALGVLQQAVRLGLRVPDDLAIVGYDDIEFAEAAAVPLTTVAQPRHLLGRTGAELLIEEARREPDHRHRQVVFTPELVVRASTARQPPAQRQPARRQFGVDVREDDLVGTPGLPTAGVAGCGQTTTSRRGLITRG